MSHTALRALVACLCYVLVVHISVSAQTPPSPIVAAAQSGDAARTSDSAATTKTRADDALDEVSRQLREQREEIERLQSTLKEQMRLIEALRARIERTEQASDAATTSATGATTTVNVKHVALSDMLPAPGTVTTTAQKSAEARAQGIEERIAVVEAQSKQTGDALSRQLGSIRFSGDVRFRIESFYGQLNASPNSDNSAVLGNPLSSRQRLRLRARLALRGRVNDEFDWGLRLATGSFPEVTSANQTLTDFYSHKNFALDQAYIGYTPAAVPGLRIQAGKFEPPWVRTEMTFDNDIQVEGLSQSYTRDFKNSTLANITVSAWQLPFLERASAFVLGADGRVNVEQSRRAGRDLALYGAQLLTQFQTGKNTRLSVSAADLYYSGTQFITPAQFFGGNVQVPVTITIPATATTPAQTVTGQVALPRERFVAGNNLGVLNATSNAVNRDGRLASGFNLVDLIARLDLSHHKKFPVVLLMNYTLNTQARDVIKAGAGGENIIQPNNENSAYWAEIQVGKIDVRGDWRLGYVFTRIEKDSVLTPFNLSDITPQSDVRAQRFNVAYAVDPRVTLAMTAILARRANGLAGVFGATPPGSLNTTGTRLQFDTQFRF